MNKDRFEFVVMLIAMAPGVALAMFVVAVQFFSASPAR